MTIQAPRTGPRVECDAPFPDLVVVGISGEVRTEDCPALVERLCEQVDGLPAVLVLDLSGVTVFEPRGAEALAAVRAHALERGVPVEHVVATYAVAKPMQLTDPDAFARAWPSLGRAMAAIRGAGEQARR